MVSAKCLTIVGQIRLPQAQPETPDSLCPEFAISPRSEIAQQTSSIGRFYNFVIISTQRMITPARPVYPATSLRGFSRRRLH